IRFRNGFEAYDAGDLLDEVRLDGDVEAVRGRCALPAVRPWRGLHLETFERELHALGGERRTEKTRKLLSAQRHRRALRQMRGGVSHLDGTRGAARDGREQCDRALDSAAL